MSAHDVLQILKDAALRHGLRPSLVVAVATKESSLNTWATRFEPGWVWWLTTGAMARVVGTTEATEKIHQATSWGLMQVMGAVARELGFRGPMPMLCEPRMGADVACRKLSACIDKWGTETRGIQAYNAGKPGTQTGIAYADAVYRLERR